MSEHTHRLRIVQVQNFIEEGRIKVTFEVLDLSLDTPDFSRYLLVPDITKGEKTYKQAQYELKLFFDAFGISLFYPTNPEEDWLGLEGEVKMH